MKKWIAIALSLPLFAHAGPTLDQMSLGGFVCQTDFDEDSGLYAIDAGFLTRSSERIAKLIAFGDGETHVVGTVRLMSSVSAKSTVYFSDGKKQVYIKVANSPDRLGRYPGVAKADQVSGLEYHVLCVPKKLF